VLGQAGRGTIDHFQLHGRVQFKWERSQGDRRTRRLCSGSRDLIEFLSPARGPCFHLAPPSVAASRLAAFDVLEETSAHGKLVE
jgi:glycine C-acetyltransferase